MDLRFLTALFLAIILCSSQAPDYALAAAQEKFLLFYSNDIEGETEPCG